MKSNLSMFFLHVTYFWYFTVKIISYQLFVLSYCVHISLLRKTYFSFKKIGIDLCFQKIRKIKVWKEKKNAWQIPRFRLVSKLHFDKMKPLYTCITNLKFQNSQSDSICLVKLRLQFSLSTSKEDYIWIDNFRMTMKNEEESIPQQLVRKSMENWRVFDSQKRSNLIKIVIFQLK